MPSGLLNEKLCGESSGSSGRSRRAALNSSGASGRRRFPGRALVGLELDPQLAAPLLERELDALGDALALVRSHDQPVHHQRDGVLELLVELRQPLVEPVLRPVDLDPHEAAAPELLEAGP